MSKDIVGIGAASGALYAVIYVLQRAMWPVDPASHVGRVAAAYVAATIVLFAAYAAVLRMLYREAPGGARGVVLAIPVAIAIALSAGRPYQSIDVWTYVAQGRQVVEGSNPYLEPVKTIASTPGGAALAAEGWIPVHDVSPYGPLWTTLEALAVRATANLASAGRVLKLAAAAFGLGCGFLIWLILGRAAPSMQLLGTAAYLWNPVVLMEFAAEGHNDSVMIFFVLLSIYLWIARRPIAGIAAMATGVAIKIVSGMVAPLVLVHAWRESRLSEGKAISSPPGRGTLVTQIAMGAVVGIVILATTYFPYWAGTATFDGIRAHGRPGMMAGSTPTVLFWFLTRTHSEAAASAVLSAAMGLLFIAFVAVVSTRIKDVESLLIACGATALAYLFIAPGYWPWYAAMPIALLALSPNLASLGAIVAVSIASRLAAPIDALRLNGLLDWHQELFAITIVGVWIPAAAIVAVGAWRALASHRIRRAAFAM